MDTCRRTHNSGSSRAAASGSLPLAKKKNKGSGHRYETVRSSDSGQRAFDKLMRVLHATHAPVSVDEISESSRCQDAAAAVPTHARTSTAADRMTLGLGVQYHGTEYPDNAPTRKKKNPRCASVLCPALYLTQARHDHSGGGGLSLDGDIFILVCVAQLVCSVSTSPTDARRPLPGCRGGVDRRRCCRPLPHPRERSGRPGVCQGAPGPCRGHAGARG